MRRLLLAFASLSLLAQSGKEILERVDRLRHPWPTFSVELTVKTAKLEQRWRVSARENGDARMDGLSPKEQGRSVLMLGDHMWLLLPGTRRPVPVTPNQRLLGPAGAGDVARIRFHEDYRLEALAEDQLEGRACWRLELSARGPLTSARKVQLWVAKEGLIPLKAEFWLASGKLARTAEFGPPTRALGRMVLSGMRVREPDGSDMAFSFSAWMKDSVEPSLFVLPGQVR